MKPCKCGKEVAGNADRCPECGHRFTHPLVKFLGYFLAGSIAIGLIGGIIVFATGSDQTTASTTPAKPVKVHSADSDYGPTPNKNDLGFAVHELLKPNLNDPASLQDVQLGEPTKATATVLGKKVKCWKVRFSYRARNGYNALHLDTGTVWAKDDMPLQLARD